MAHERFLKAACVCCFSWGILGSSLLGFTCFVYRPQWEPLTDYYLMKRYPGYDEEFRGCKKEYFNRFCCKSSQSTVKRKITETEIQTCMSRLRCFCRYCYPAMGI